MSEDWLEVLREQGEIAQRMARDVAELLGHPGLTLDQASRMYRLVEKGAQDFDRMVEALEEQDALDAVLEAAETIQSIWDELSIATANKVRTLRGLEPIEFPDDED
ncbi:hypothetical protein [Nitratireductor sp. GCM10026969]|uniref:hypothetical protein n=1 Tax=Nitratireductor sp. GCM10026969 TaxID=3252645 RepID=UPI0036135FD6